MKMEYYLDIKKNEIMLLAGICVELEIRLSEISQTHKDKNHMFPLICGINRKKRDDLKVEEVLLRKKRGRGMEGGKE
jgi:hypothetical protein